MAILSMGRSQRLLRILLLLLLSITGAEFRKDPQEDVKSPPPASPPLGAPLSNNSKIIPAAPEVTNSNSVQSNETGNNPAQETSGTQNTTQKVDETASDPTHCCGSTVRACLSSSGDSSSEMLLTIKSRDNVKVKIVTPSFLSADPSELTTAGKEQPVRIEMIDVEAAKHQSSTTNITIKSDAEVCELPVPSQVLGDSPPKDDLPHGFDYSTMRTPVVGFSMLALALALVIAAWAFCRYKLNKNNRHAAESDGPKYVELEMGENSHDNAAGTSAAGLGRKDAGDDGWDEVWDEDWDDSQNVGSSSFKLSQSLSSKGLAARRTSKEGWAD